jgi:hypothetical protein
MAAVLAGRQPMTLTLFYFDGCPHWMSMDERLKAALRRIGRDDTVERRRVETIEDAQAVGFTGSPMIRLNGSDPFGDLTTPASLSCRMYQTPDGPAGSPTVDQLVEALR